MSGPSRPRTTAVLRRNRLRESRFARGPWRITFDTNPDNCNLRCIMCEEHSPHSTLQAQRRAAGRARAPDGYLALIRRVLEDSRVHGLREIIPSTMGEPLLYEGFEEILDLCREFGVKLNLTTNGTFPRPGCAGVGRADRAGHFRREDLLERRHARRPTRRIMLGSRWEQVLENVRAFVAVRDAHAAAGGNRCRVTFQLRSSRRNVDELADVVRLAAPLGVDRVKGHHLWAHFAQIERTVDAPQPRGDRDAGTRRRCDAGGRDKPCCRTASACCLENIFPLDPAHARISRRAAPARSSEQEAWVSAEGRFDPCCAPDAQSARSASSAISKTSDQGDLERPAYQRLAANYRTDGCASACNMRRPVDDHAADWQACIRRPRTARTTSSTAAPLRGAIHERAAFHEPGLAPVRRVQRCACHIDDERASRPTPRRFQRPSASTRACAAV